MQYLRIKSKHVCMYAAECKSYHKVFHVFYSSIQQNGKALLQSSSNAGSNFNIKIRFY